MSTIVLSVPDMHCAACTEKIRRLIAHTPNITDLRFNPVRKQVLVSHNGDASAADLVQRIEKIGFHPTLEQDGSQDRASNRDLLKRLGIAGLALMQVMMAQAVLYFGGQQGIEPAIQQLFSYTALIFCIPVISYAAVPFFRSGFGDLRSGINMDTPIALAITIAFLASLHATITETGETYYDSVAMFTFLLLGARYIDTRLRSRLTPAAEMIGTLPSKVIMISDGQHTEVSVDSVKPNDLLWIKEGAQLPVDGTLVDEYCIVDEALISGESDWCHRLTNSPLFAGSFNRGAGFRLCVTSGLDQSRLADIERLAIQSLAEKHGLERFADRVAKRFLPAILFAGLATLMGWLFVAPAHAITATIAVLIVSCPCALALATPAALNAATSRLRQLGVLVKSAGVLEQAYRVGQVIFDKTGTLASPQLQINRVRNYSNHPTHWCCNAASALQMHSSHPLASAFDQHSILEARAVSTASGQGVEGVIGEDHVKLGSAEFCDMTDHADETLGNQVFLNVNGQPAASFELVESPRRDAASTIQWLRNHGIASSLLSGDRKSNCRRLAAPLNMSFRAQQSPEQKFHYMQRARITAHANKRALLYVGDGINDIPALAAADLSVATLETNDLVKSRADAILLTQRFAALADFLNIGRACQKIIRQNLIWALLYNLTMIPLAASGMLPPWAAAVGMSASSILVMANSARLLAFAPVPSDSATNTTPTTTRPMAS